MKAAFGVLGVLVASAAQAAPLSLYDTSRDSTALAPLAATPSCGGFAVACSDAPTPPKTVLPFEFGGSVSGMVGGGSRIGGVSGEAVSGWVRARDVPLTLYFSYQRLQPLGR